MHYLISKQILSRIYNIQYERYKQILRKEGFEALQDQPHSETQYVVGTEHLRQKLEYIAPMNNFFTFHKNGTSFSNGEPVSAISFDTISHAVSSPSLKKEE
ncbi:hypothetical protein [Paenisporosarcina sp. TG20]|uniref:hypothetical protein n=1 Tax=Paenisporosarcina sp. TG20 TaxID=1211706 RepID=UPI0002FB2495|nr:hypothetical protein [Paenisporosarcina sp. TG20]